MKNRFLNFGKKYLLCFLLSVLMVIGISLSNHYADSYESGSEGDMIRFDLSELYLIYVLPLYSLIYGGLSYAVSRRVWIPQLILCAINFLYWFRFDLKAFAWEGTYIWSIYPVVFSLVGSSIVALICKLIKSITRKTKPKT